MTNTLIRCDVTVLYTEILWYLSSTVKLVSLYELWITWTKSYIQVVNVLFILYKLKYTILRVGKVGSEVINAPINWIQCIKFFILHHICSLHHISITKYNNIWLEEPVKFTFSLNKQMQTFDESLDWISSLNQVSALCKLFFIVDWGWLMTVTVSIF